MDRESTRRGAPASPGQRHQDVFTDRDSGIGSAPERIRTSDAGRFSARADEFGGTGLTVLAYGDRTRPDVLETDRTDGNDMDQKMDRRESSLVFEVDIEDPPCGVVIGDNDNDDDYDDDDDLDDDFDDDLDELEDDDDDDADDDDEF